VAAELAGAGLVEPFGEAGGQGDAVALDAAAVGAIRDPEPQKRHGSDVSADGLLDPRLLRRLGPCRSSQESSSSPASFSRPMMAAPVIDSLLQKVTAGRGYGRTGTACAAVEVGAPIGHASPMG
jgi:hypothetical protein